MRQVDKILVCRGSGRAWGDFEDELEGLRVAAEGCRGEEVVARLRGMLPEYVTPEAVGVPSGGG